MRIEWRATDIKGRIPVTVVWIVVTIVDSILVSLWAPLTTLWWALLVARSASYAFQDALLLRNWGPNRNNMMNVWQYAPTAVGTAGVVLSVLCYTSVYVVNAWVLATPASAFSASSEGAVIGLKVLIAVHTLLILTGLQLQYYTAYRVLVKGERDYEMMPIVLADTALAQQAEG